MGNTAASNQSLTHLDASGRASMVDISAKPLMKRRAVAEARLHAQEGTVDRIFGEGEALPKGDVLATARLAGVMAAKKTGELIPLCHPLPIDHARVHIERVNNETIRIEAEATVVGRTGVEMEALTAVTVAALTIYDMVKAIDNVMRIERVVLVEKTKQPM